MFRSTPPCTFGISFQKKFLRKKFFFLIGSGVFFLSSSGCRKTDIPKDLQPPVAVETSVPFEGFQWVAESHRPLHFLIIGLGPLQKHYPYLASLDKAPQTLFLAKLEEAFFALDFELSHGTLIGRLPEHTRIFAAVPDIPPGSRRRIQTFFENYLRKRWKWNDRQIAERLAFFPADSPLIWVQDAGEFLGETKDGRAVLRIDLEGGRPEYHRALQNLEHSFPNFFQLWKTKTNIPAEGGDEEVVLFPNGHLGLLVGRHRVYTYLERETGENPEGFPIDNRKLEEARQAFSSAFGGLPVLFVPEAVLRDPSLGTQELFHLDMVVSVLHSDRGAFAAVPTFSGEVVDAESGEKLDQALARACQREWDETARQMKHLGFQVIRLPFADHPARSPVNLVKARDPKTGEALVFLARYPNHLPMENPETPQKKLRNALWNLEDRTNEWLKEPTLFRQKKVEEALKNLWDMLDQAPSEPNPLFDEQVRLLQKAGFRVVEVPMFPWGSGGLHCLQLR